MKGIVLREKLPFRDDEPCILFSIVIKLLGFRVSFSLRQISPLPSTDYMTKVFSASDLQFRHLKSEAKEPFFLVFLRFS